MSILTPFIRPIADVAYKLSLPAKITSVEEFCDYYGDPGRSRDTADPTWVKRNIVELQGDQALPGIPPKWYFKTHRLVVPHLERALKRALLECPEYKIERAASFVFRHQRHDTVEKARAAKRPLRPLSRHSWGGAIDVDSDKNGARSYPHGKGSPRPWSPAWLKLWPDGLPESFVRAFEREGWTWGGRWVDYRDPMHFQWDRRPS